MTTPLQYRKKPVVIDAMHFSGEMDADLELWLDDAFCSWLPSRKQLELHTLEGPLTASAGDWIIRGVKGEFYPCKPDIFEQTYTPVEPPAAKHLWEIDHPYYGPDGCYFANGAQFREAHLEHESWQAFVEGGDYYGADLDMNFLYRWDWIRQDPADVERFGLEPAPDTLELYIMQPRKGYMGHATITVTEADEPAVIEWLRTRAEYLTRVWEPFIALAEIPEAVDAA